MSDSMDPIKRIGRRLRDLAIELGCDMENFAILPDIDGDNDLVNVVFLLPKPEDKPPHPELVGVDIDAEAERLLASIAEHETQASRASKDDEVVETLLAARERLREEPPPDLAP